MKKKQSGQKYQFACFECRKVFKQDTGRALDVLKCPNCRGTLTLMGKTFRAPRRQDGKQWKKVELLARNGVVFWSGGHRLPDTLSEAKQYVAKNRKRTDGEVLAQGIKHRKEQ